MGFCTFPLDNSAKPNGKYARQGGSYPIPIGYYPLPDDNDTGRRGKVKKEYRKMDCMMTSI